MRRCKLSLRILTLLLLAGVFLGTDVARARATGNTAISGDAYRVLALPDHVPSWANQDNYVGPVPPAESLPPMTLVLARHPDRQAAFEKLLADQQDPASPSFHQWLTPSEIGERYGLTTEELDALTGWLKSQGLRVDWVASGRNFIGFSGAAADIGRAFQTELNYYHVDGERKLSIATPPMLPTALAPMVKAIRGLYTINDRPLHKMRVVRSDSPELTLNNGEHFLMPIDFATIYDQGYKEAGNLWTVGIVGRSTLDPADFKIFRELAYLNSQDPAEVVPTSFGGVSPGPPYTSPPTGNESTADQAEATLDVQRVAGVAGDPNILLVVATQGSGGIEVDAQYLIQSEPVPAQVVNISFGACESEAGQADVAFWNRLFEQAAGEGISVLVASGDSGASGCDASFSTPPAYPYPNSPNYICSSSYATCVGGTEFNDFNDPSAYWRSENLVDFWSAISYIPEGAWNEPLNESSETQAASSGGGVSQFIPTPAWQTGNGVPSARAGRYTPDLAFSASAHDGYFGCMAAAGGSCVYDSQGNLPFIVFSGTSAAAPGMAGITALLLAQLQEAQGNLNPSLYSLATSMPSAFHDVTVATSGVTSCNIDTPSMCNNSVPRPNGLTDGQAGFEVGPGYDEVTGLGSLDITNFLNSYASTKPPLITAGVATSIKPFSANLVGILNPQGIASSYWFLYGTSASLKTSMQAKGEPASGTNARTVTVPVTQLSPDTKYYFRMQASNGTGIVSGPIASFTTPRGPQTIQLSNLPTILRYGASPITFSASANLPPTLKVLQGHAKLSDYHVFDGDWVFDTLTLTGSGTVVVSADQAGNAAYYPAPQVTRTITVEKARLDVAANDRTMKQGAKLPKLTYVVSGFVYNDTQSTATKGQPALTTSATSKSKPGKYPITITQGTLSAPFYTFKFVDATLTVEP
jgi:subtilase family serine protease